MPYCCHHLQNDCHYEFFKLLFVDVMHCFVVRKHGIDDPHQGNSNATLLLHRAILPPQYDARGG